MGNLNNKRIDFRLIVEALSNYSGNMCKQICSGFIEKIFFSFGFVEILDSLDFSTETASNYKNQSFKKKKSILMIFLGYFGSNSLPSLQQIIKVQCLTRNPLSIGQLACHSKIFPIHIINYKQ